MNHHSAFTLVNKTKHPTLDQTLLEFKHNITGARHIHIQSDDAENTFMVVLKTIPEGSSISRSTIEIGINFWANNTVWNVIAKKKRIKFMKLVIGSARCRVG